ncbi:hypothetical protein [Ligilactobacillus ruminis]|uniref:hypothetical protein n=1 Tax=Ligilactobacillus ruminis TaxID=1623 RepID=UPI0012B01A34|nr:hypothetical protein [Ligilactobacillus ruminis]MSB30976.1 hypothetical protein [Ligilactobacillus ruminis]
MKIQEREKAKKKHPGCLSEGFPARCLQREMAGSFPRSLPTTPHFEICQMKQGFFSLLSTTDKTPKMPNTNAKKIRPHLLLQSAGGKMAGSGARQQKSSKSFSRLTAFDDCRWMAGIHF